MSTEGLLGPVGSSKTNNNNKNPTLYDTFILTGGGVHTCRPPVAWLWRSEDNFQGSSSHRGFVSDCRE